MTSNSDPISAGRTLAEVLSSVPPIPPGVLAATVAARGFTQRHGSWVTYRSGGRSWNVPQIITALVLIEQSPAGEAWDVQLAAIPDTVRAPVDTRYSAGFGGLFAEAFGYVEWFFERSGLSEGAPQATVKWEDPEAITATHLSGVQFSCSAICKMLYAAQRLQSQEIKSQEIKSQETELSLKLEQVGLQLQQVSLELQKITSDIRNRPPAVTCVMHLFAGYTNFRYSHCTSTVSTGTNTHIDTPASPSSSSPAHPAAIATTPTFSIALYTDRLSDLSPGARDWIFKQLDTRTVWVRVTEPDSHNNHISWTPFNGAVELSGKTVAFSYGNYRFW